VEKILFEPRERGMFHLSKGARFFFEINL